MLSTLLSLRGLPPPLRGSCSCSSLTPAHEVQFSPLPRTSFAPRLGFAQSAFHLLRSQSALSFPSPLRSTFPSRLCGPVGNTSVSNFSTSSSFRIRKSIGRGYSSRSSQVFGLPSSTHPPLSTLLVFVPLLGYTYIHPPLFPPPKLAPYCFLRVVDLSVAIQKPPSVTPILLAVANADLPHPPGTPHQSLRYSLSHPAIGHSFLPRHSSGVQVHTLTS